MDVLTLLDWCSVNGIRISPSLRILRHDKKGICVRAANSPILPERSRKPVPLHTSLHLLTTERDIRSCFLTTSLMYLSSSVDVSCRNPEIRRVVRPFVCIRRPYPSRSVRSRCHPYPRLGSVLRTVRPITDCALRSTYLPPINCAVQATGLTFSLGRVPPVPSERSKLGWNCTFLGRHLA
jgi:hypothetical protein